MLRGLDAALGMGWDGYAWWGSPASLQGVLQINFGKQYVAPSH